MCWTPRAQRGNDWWWEGRRGGECGQDDGGTCNIHPNITTKLFNSITFAHFHPKIKQTCRLHGFNHQHLAEAPSLMRRLVGLTDGQHGATSSTFIWMDRPANRSSHNGRRRPPSLPSVVTVTAHLSLHLAGANLIGLTQSVPSGTALRSAELRGGR